MSSLWGKALRLVAPSETPTRLPFVNVDSLEARGADPVRVGRRAHPATLFVLAVRVKNVNYRLLMQTRMSLSILRLARRWHLPSRAGKHPCFTNLAHLMPSKPRPG